jgi:alanyl-tRNA synthetase
LSAQDIKNVEDLVNSKIRENIAVHIEYTSFKKAIDRGVLAFFGEKYNPEHVRVVDVPGFSMELCGGTHVTRTGDIGVFKITDVVTIAAGHRRIFAATGPGAVNLFQETFETNKKLSQLFSVKREEVVQHVEKQADEIKHLHKEIKTLKQKMMLSQLPMWEKEIETIQNVPFLFVHTHDASQDELRTSAQLLQEKKDGFYFLISSADARTSFVASVGPKTADMINLKNLASWLQDTHALRGGGSKNSLQGGGGQFDPQLRDSIIEWLRKK